MVARVQVPFLLGIQNDLHFHLRTRMVVPLVRCELQRVGISALCPVFSIQTESVFASVPEMASFPARELEDWVFNLNHKRGEIFEAVDLLLHGF
ncbi:CcdB family protein [Geomonas sp.]|uniref:CcdB family protein n=1 Tax=Geomonas sp. TaxID=2651584 RepID=UPI002B4A83CD|nr:CcdB family protein [Geomonas sp.]